MGRAPWSVAPLDDVAALAALLDEDMERLLWLADPRGYQRRAPEGPLHHYRSTWLPRPGRAPRLLEAPLPRLKGTQRTVLRAVLDAVPPHEAAHGYVRGRSAVTHAAAHTGHRLVLTLDLQAFFASVSAARVYGVFRSCGYPEAVAHLLTGLCTVATPLAVLRGAPAGPGLAALRRELATPHLPQGAPTSPALANLVAQGLDRRLAGLAARYGLAYTRYADDLCFSGRALPRLLVTAVGDVVRDEGFEVQEAKTRLRGRSQRQLVTGVVVNEHTAPRRADYDALKALLHDARLHGCEVAGRRHPHHDLPSHVLGRIAWVAALHPERGARLRAAFDEVQRAQAVADSGRRRIR
jgi:hypothetical protein